MIRIPASLSATMFACIALSTPLTAADDHAGHDHAKHNHGKAVALGEVKTGEQRLLVSGAGAIAPGKPWHVELVLKPDQPTPKAIRLWVGLESGRGSVKTRAAAEKGAKGEYVADLEVPDPIPADSKLWLAIEAANESVFKTSLALPQAGAAKKDEGHHAGDGHHH